MKLKTKPLTRKQLTSLVADYELRFEALADTLEDLSMHQPDYSGALQLNIVDDNDKTTSFYMVTKFCIVDPFVTFYHLLPLENDETTTINSFPEKPKDKSTRAFIRSLEKQKRWNKVYERLFIPNVLRTQFIGHFTYTKVMDLEDNTATFIRPDSKVLEFKATSEED